nr:CerR family C-terminal domain-containing protein [uncultured Desulfobacter sp.]
MKKRSRLYSTHVGDETRQRLINAGVEIFGRCGYEAATTRMFAEAAEVNLAAIPYHFGSKEGLYHAVIESVGDRILELLKEERLKAVETVRNETTNSDDVKKALDGIIRGFARILISSELGRQAAPIIMREQAHPTTAFDRLYENHLRPIHEVITVLVARLRKESPDSENAVICAHTIIGQIAAFRMMRETARRRLGWDTFDEQKTEKICDLIIKNTHSILMTEH